MMKGGVLPMPMTAPRFSLIVALLCVVAPAARAQTNLFQNPDLQQHTAANPTNYDLAGDVEYRYVGRPGHDYLIYGVAFQSAKPGAAGSISQTVGGIDAG